MQTINYPAEAEDEAKTPHMSKQDANKHSVDDNDSELTEEEQEEVDLRGFQVVRREFFAHVREPSIIFNDGKIGVNTACVRKLPEVEYVQVLVHREKKQLVIRPCDEFDYCSFQWIKIKDGKRFPRQITARFVYMKLCDLMGWIPQYRYKILGKLRRANGEYVFVFDLNATETYERSVTADGKKRSSRTPVFPAAWKDQFGIPFEEHQKALQIDLFDGYAVFSLSDKESRIDEKQSPEAIQGGK